MRPKGVLKMILLAVLAASAPVTARQAPDALERTYLHAITSAEDAWSRAASVGGQWRDTREVLLAAVEAAQQGDFRRAIELAEKARSQSEFRYGRVVADQRDR